ncbi:MAG TPA: alpha-glucuronidase family glycosyl hydrolase, partial [Blastocatellia bacterium]|nr:alpha-glucuronidase family glycosyl hydrolase [Blastocatellia bacterium]
MTDCEIKVRQMLRAFKSIRLRFKASQSTGVETYKVGKRDLSPPLSNGNTSNGFGGGPHERALINPSSRPVISACCAVLVSVLFFAVPACRADDGYRLWLRYDPLPQRSIRLYRPRVTAVVVTGTSATLAAVRSELVSGCSGLLGSPIATATSIERNGAVVVGTPKSS